ncbi:hypothetical protein [Brevibacillus brevis]|nr:hypothetical protein [Brevibacillus brevis]
MKTYQDNDSLQGFVQAKALLTTELVGLGLLSDEQIQALQHAFEWIIDAF